MPVVFVLFKSSTEKISLFVTRLWSSATRRSRPKSEARGASDAPLDPYQETDNINLPGIASTDLTVLRSFLRNIGRTNPLINYRG